jgi:uncharacterized protein DUF4389
MVDHPARFEAEYVERRSRLSTFFRWLLVIPPAIVLALWGFVAWFAVVAAWFAIVVTGRYPLALYEFVAGFTRYLASVSGYAGLLTDRFPPFSGAEGLEYPVRLRIGPPLEQYSRAKAAFRLVLAIPVMLIAYAMRIVAQVGSFLAWFAIVVLGRQPEALQSMIVLGLSYEVRAYTYFLLLDEAWPPFTDAPALPAGPDVHLPPGSGVTPG